MTTSQNADSVLYAYRSQTKRRGYAELHTRAPACTEQDSRAMADAVLCEKPKLNAVALRWDGR